MTSFFEHQRTSFKRSYLKNLIALASSDGYLDESEAALIYNIGFKRGLKEWQIKDLLENREGYEVFIPESIGNRMNLLYDLMLIIYADQQVDVKELEFVNNIIRSFQLDPGIISELLPLFDGGVPSALAWSEFVDFVIVSDRSKQSAVL